MQPFFGCILLNRHYDQILPKMQPFLDVFFSTGILIRLCHKCNLFHLHCQAKEAELPESGNDPKDDKNSERVEPEEQWGPSGRCERGR